MESNETLLFVIIQCIPVPIMLKITRLKSILIPIVVKRNITVKAFFKQLTEHVRREMELKGLEQMMANSKLIIND